MPFTDRQQIIRVLKTILLISYDLSAIIIAYFLAFSLRFGSNIPANMIALLVNTLPLVVPVQMLSFFYFQYYSRLWRYASLEDSFAIIRASFFAILASMAAVFLAGRLDTFPRTVFLLDGLLLGALVSFGRLGYRALYELLRQSNSGEAAIIVGGGESGAQLLRSIQNDRKLGIKVVGFIDDDLDKQHRTIMGFPVLGGIGQLRNIVNQKKIRQVLIAISTATPQILRKIVEECETADVKVRTIPSLSQLVGGDVRYQELRPLVVDDLLGRPPVEIDLKPARRLIEGATVLVTGAGGSIGSELCRQIANLNPHELVLLDHSEYLLYMIDSELKSTYPGLRRHPFLANICDFQRMKNIMREKQPGIVLHAAAYKHVPILESHPSEGILNNIGGTLAIAEAAIECKIKRFVNISTDKAVNPVNILGATKRAAEKLCLALQRQTSDTEFSTVRFGNVLGSTGSVIALFEKQIKSGGPLTVTHPEISRYFMSVVEATRLVLLAASLGKSGEIFVLDMGEPIRIMEVARAMIKLDGKTPGHDIQIQITGLRPGEKLHEELFFAFEKKLPTAHPKIFAAKTSEPEDSIIDTVKDFLGKTRLMDDDSLRQTLREIVPEYSLIMTEGSSLHQPVDVPPQMAEKNA